jgi:hypothetical protein
LNPLFVFFTFMGGILYKLKLHSVEYRTLDLLMRLLYRHQCDIALDKARHHFQTRWSCILDCIVVPSIHQPWGASLHFLAWVLSEMLAAPCIGLFLHSFAVDGVSELYLFIPTSTVTVTFLTSFPTV